jgi:hypothetical protein
MNVKFKSPEIPFTRRCPIKSIKINHLPIHKGRLTDPWKFLSILPPPPPVA